MNPEESRSVSRSSVTSNPIKRPSTATGIRTRMGLTNFKGLSLKPSHGDIKRASTDLRAPRTPGSPGRSMSRSPVPSTLISPPPKSKSPEPSTPRSLLPALRSPMLRAPRRRSPARQEVPRVIATYSRILSRISHLEAWERYLEIERERIMTAKNILAFYLKKLNGEIPEGSKSAVLPDVPVICPISKSRKTGAGSNDENNERAQKISIINHRINEQLPNRLKANKAELDITKAEYDVLKALREKLGRGKSPRREHNFFDKSPAKEETAAEKAFAKLSPTTKSKISTSTREVTEYNAFRLILHILGNNDLNQVLSMYTYFMLTGNYKDL